MKMSKDFELLEPQSVWAFFGEICQIPRASGNTLALQDWLLDFAASRGLEAKRDDIGNVLIRKSATKGMESHPSVALQAHMDMVCEKNADTSHDFSKDPIQPWIDGEWMKAKGTTLGADNGIGMAAQLAVLDSAELSHGPIECLFTVDEETGLYGAFGLEAGFLESKKLINLDSEDEGEVFIGCAGGMNSEFSFEFQTEPSPTDYFYFKVSVKGLTGGHSGDDIEKGRGNANHLLARCLYDEKANMDLRISSFVGGNLSNAIPREAVCVAGVPWSKKESVRVRLNCLLADLEEEFGPIEPNLSLGLESVQQPEFVLIKADGDRFVNAIYGCPIGVQAMSHALPGLVDTSLNLASVKAVDANKWIITTSQRSSYESAKYALSNRLNAHFSLAGMKVSHGEGYPGWAPNPDSELLQIVSETYRQLAGKDPVVRAIHAGLECGLFLQKYPWLDMVSFGPTMRGVHSPDERLHIPAVGSFWQLLLGTLERI
jgi:dipeptidase D